MTQPTSPAPSYAHAPIEEALVEFRFEPVQEWDLTIPGKVHEKIKADYPGKPRQQKLVQAAVQAAPGQPTGLSVQEGIARVQLVDADALRLVSLGADALSVHVLRPYDGWTSFRPRIEAALRAYLEVAAPTKLTRVGVRYINKVVIPRSEIDLRDYFTCAPNVPATLPQRVSSFLNRGEHAFEDGAKLLLTFASLPSDRPNTATFLLDLDVSWEGLETLDLGSAMQRGDDLHQREGRAFEALITDSTRKVFRGA